MGKLMITKRGTKWQYRFYIGTVDGKKKFISKSGFRTQKEALTAGNEEMYLFQNEGVKLNNTNISLQDFMNYWYENYAMFNYKPNTLDLYKRHIDIHINKELGSYKITDLTTLLIQRFVNNLKIKGYSKSHTSGILSTLSKALTYAVENMQYIRTNPCEKVKLPKFEKLETDRYIISNEDIKIIFQRFKDTDYYIPLLIGYYTGFRIGEVYALTWSDVNFKNKTITVHKNMITKKTNTENIGTTLGSPKTSNSYRTIKVGDTLINELKKHKTEQMKNKIFYGEHYIKNCKKLVKNSVNNEMITIISLPSHMDSDLEEIDFICTKKNGQVCTQDSFKYASRVINHSLGIKFNFHSLRHTHATKLIESGANIKEV